MAILGQIRKQTGLLIGAIAIGLLAFLVPWSSVSNFFSGHKDPNVYGKVNGEAITRQEFENQRVLVQNQYQGQVSDVLLQGQVWNSLVQNKLVQQKFEDAGFVLTDKMIWNIAKYSPMFANNPQFVDKNGTFNVQAVQDLMQRLQSETNNPQAQEQYHLLQTMKNNFGYQAMYKQYFGAYGAGMLSNSKEIDVLAQNQLNVANIDYVKIDYDAYQKQNPVKVTDEDLQKYIDKHKSLFKIDANRILDYVFFSGAPSPTDRQASLAEINKYLTNSVVDGDTIQAFPSVKNDSMYVTQYSDKQFIPTYRYAQQLPAEIQNWVKGASIGQISSAYEVQDYYVLSKLIGKKNTDSIQAQDILISYTGSPATPKTARNKEQAKKQADDLAAQLNANISDFAKLALQFSDDPNTAQKGGDLGWLVTSQDFAAPYKPLQTYLETGTVGKVGVVETPEGFLVLNIQQRKTGAVAYKLADLAKEIKASDATTEKARTNAVTFVQSIEGKASKEFQDKAYKSKFTPLQQTGILRFGTPLQDLGTDQDADIIEWAFDPKRDLGDTNMFTTSDGSYIVVRLSGIFKKGLAAPYLIRKDLETIVQNEKLGKIIAEKVNASQKSLDQLAAEYKTTKSSTSINFDNPAIENAFEPKVGGAAFGLKANTVSKAIEGKTGVYVIVAKSVTKGQVGDKKQLKTALINQYSQQMPALLLRTLYQEATTDDYRGAIFNQQQKRQ
ncbi:MAG: SurA N-terminal domain-containing protein [Flavobacteriaceae bacterium]|jgi:peptidyl-prolyl cis-trans isomerase D|nr:SurA N-terminal domain-containing protein [Flavobacteriaceae bacterium]